MEEKKFKDGLTLEEAKKSVDINRIIDTRNKVAIINVFVSPDKDEKGNDIQRVSFETKLAEGVCEPELGRALEYLVIDLKGKSHKPVKKEDA